MLDALMAADANQVTRRDGATVRSAALANVLRAIEGRAPVDAVCREVGLDPALASQREARIPYRQLAGLFDAAARWTADPWFGLHVGANVDARRFELIGYLTQTAATLAQAFEILARYLPLWTTCTRFHVERFRTGVEVSWTYGDPAADGWRHDCEMTMAAAIGVGGLFQAGHWRPREVHFRHPAPDDTSVHARVLRAPVRFAMPHNRFVCDAAVCDTPIAAADAGLHALLRELADGQLAAQPAQASPLDDVAGAIAALLPSGDAQISRVARTLGIGTRTLQRRLIARGATFRGLLNTVRRERATRELVESERSIHEIALGLGYAAPSELTRAFRRWTGMGPAAYRRAHRRR